MRWEKLVHKYRESFVFRTYFCEYSPEIETKSIRFTVNTFTSKPTKQSQTPVKRIAKVNSHYSAFSFAHSFLYRSVLKRFERGSYHATQSMCFEASRVFAEANRGKCICLRFIHKYHHPLHAPKPIY